jgi:hypothetical protein
MGNGESGIGNRINTRVIRDAPQRLSAKPVIPDALRRVLYNGVIPDALRHAMTQRRSGTSRLRSRICGAALHAAPRTG